MPPSQAAPLPPPTLYILYNAHSTLLGKLSYTCRKLTAGADTDPACAACDITHGGLHLNESEKWKAAKSRITWRKGGEGVKEGVTRQLHIDEVGRGEGDVKSFISAQELKYPMVLVRPPSDPASLHLLLSAQDLAACKGDPDVFLERLKEKGPEFGVGVRDAEAAGEEKGAGGGEGVAEKKRRGSWLSSKW